MLALTPDVKEAWYNLGQLHKTLGNFQTAASCFHKAAALDKTYAEPLVGLALLSDAPGKGFERPSLPFPRLRGGSLPAQRYMPGTEPL